MGESCINNSVLKWKFIKFDIKVLLEVLMDFVELKFNKSNWNVVLGEWFDVDVKLLDEFNNIV